MLVTDIQICDVLFAVYGREPVLYHVPFDPEIGEMLIEAERSFWQCVVNAAPPDPANFADVISRWSRRSIEGAVVADTNVLAAVEKLRWFKDHIDAADSVVEELKATVMTALAERDTLVDADGKVLATWKAAKPARRFDIVSFAIEHPELVSKFTKDGTPNRRFLLKG